MPKFTFKCEDSDFVSPKSTTTVEVSAVSIDEVVESFERFLRGAGFVFDGHLSFDYNTVADPTCSGDCSCVTVTGIDTHDFQTYDGYGGADVITLTQTDPIITLNINEDNK